MLLVKSTIDADVVNLAETRVRSSKPSMWERAVILPIPMRFLSRFYQWQVKTNLIKNL